MLPDLLTPSRTNTVNYIYEEWKSSILELLYPAYNLSDVCQITWSTKDKISVRWYEERFTVDLVSVWSETDDDTSPLDSLARWLNRHLPVTQGEARLYGLPRYSVEGKSWSIYAHRRDYFKKFDVSQLTEEERVSWSKLVPRKISTNDFAVNRHGSLVSVHSVSDAIPTTSALYDTKLFSSLVQQEIDLTNSVRILVFQNSKEGIILGHFNAINRLSEDMSHPFIIVEAKNINDIGVLI